MPTLVNMTGTPRARKRPGRTPESIAAYLLSAADMAEHAATATASLRDRPHLSYDPENPHRVEHARHLNGWARGVVGVEDFHRSYVLGGRTFYTEDFRE